MNYDNSLVVTITVTCYSWAPSSGDHLFTCGTICRPPHSLWSTIARGTKEHYPTYVTKQLIDHFYVG